MSFNLTGLESNVTGGVITIEIDNRHPLIQVCQSIPWEELSDLVIPDLKNTKKGFWFLGRPLNIRIHMGAYILQKIFNMTDRMTEYGIKDNAAYQIFCGRNVVNKWKAPDHTKIESFRSRLSPETQRKLANYVSKIAVKLGMANPKEMDIDSTIQEANMSYPSDANLMVKLAEKSNKVITVIKGKMEGVSDIEVSIKKIKNKARAYFFSRRKKDNRAKILRQMWDLINKEILPVIELCESLKVNQIQSLPWNIKRAVQQILSKGRQYLLDVDYWLSNGKMKSGKTMAFHIEEVACFNKGKLNNKLEFGRSFQLGRLGGNFLIAGECTTVRMDDKQSVQPMIEEHSSLFGQGTLESSSLDKGYYSTENATFLLNSPIQEVCLMKPGNIKEQIIKLSPEDRDRLTSRRDKIEPLIGHTKHGGQLGKSRMKSDKGTLCAGYGAVLGFNMRQLMRKVYEESKKNARANEIIGALVSKLIGFYHLVVRKPREFLCNRILFEKIRLLPNLGAI